MRSKRLTNVSAGCLSIARAFTPALLWLAMFIPSFAFAIGEQYGRITGIVYSPDGAELPGIKIVLESKALIGGPRTLLSKEDGSFTFNTLAPGNYTLTATSPWLKLYKQTGIQVSVGKTSVIYIAMYPNDGTEIPTSVFVGGLGGDFPAGTYPYGDVVAGSSQDKSKEDPLATSLKAEVPTHRFYTSDGIVLPGVIYINSDDPDIHGGTFGINKYIVEQCDTVEPTSLNFYKYHIKENTLNPNSMNQLFPPETTAENLQKLPKQSQNLEEFLLPMPSAKTSNGTLLISGATPRLVVDGQLTPAPMRKSSRQ
jgi:hypothetical protein